MKNNPKRMQILKTAQKRFARHGLSKTTVEEIARDLRIGKATLYHYFSSKEDIFYEVLKSEIEKYITDVKNIFDNSENDSTEKLLSYFNFKQNMKGNYSLIYELFIIIINNNPLDRDIEIYEFLKKEEEKTLTEFFENFVLQKKKNWLNDGLAKFLAFQSWSFFLLPGFEKKEDTEKKFNQILRSFFEYLLQ